MGRIGLAFLLDGDEAGRIEVADDFPEEMALRTVLHDLADILHDTLRARCRAFERREPPEEPEEPPVQ